jgi:hypothetical protein
LGKKAKKAKRKIKKKLARKLDPPERAMAPASATAERAGTDLPPSAMREPDYPDDARAVQRTPKAKRKRKSAIKKKTIKAMHQEVNRRIAAVGAEQTVLDEDMPDHEKFVQLTRQTGNIGDTLAGQAPAPELIYSELIRLMALCAAWAQSIAPKRGQR